jgi:hypothetical protein
VSPSNLGTNAVTSTQDDQLTQSVKPEPQRWGRQLRQRGPVAFRASVDHQLRVGPDHLGHDIKTHNTGVVSAQQRGVGPAKCGVDQQLISSPLRTLLHGSRPRPRFPDHPQSLAAATRFLHGAVHGRQRPHRMPVPLATLTERHTPGIGTQCRPQPTPITVRGHHPDWVTAIQSTRIKATVPARNSSSDPYSKA